MKVSAARTEYETGLLQNGSFAAVLLRKAYTSADMASSIRASMALASSMEPATAV